PPSVVLETAGDFARVPETWFPVVVKPHRSVVRDGERRRRLAVAFAADRVACRRILAALPPAAVPVLVQRRVAGSGEGLFALRWSGRMVAMFAHRRLREKPPVGGVSVYRESVALSPDLVKAGSALLEALSWNGLAMIECRREASSGRHVVMEINGRLWGSLQLAIDAGIDFPTLLMRCSLGEQVATPPSYRVGVRSRWFWGDVDHLYLRLRRSASELGLVPPTPTRWEAVRQFLSVRPGRDRCEVWRWRDPLPFLVETLQWLTVRRSVA
ncbi:MAG: ATP-grasp domain-containing protein, partial [Acidimicrobiales bacterium]